MIEELITQHEGGVLTLTLNRPQKKNALTSQMYTSLANALEAAAIDSQVDVVVLRGADGNLTAGNDLQDFLQHPPTAENSPVLRFMHAWRTLPQPNVVAVEGFAVGIGVTLLLHADIVIASEDARLALPFVKLGLVPEYASSYLLPKLAGMQRASEIVLLGEPFSAATAQQIGLVNRVVPISEITSTLADITNKLTMLPPQALRHSKRLLRSSVQAEIDSSLARELEIFTAQLTSREFKEAATAFLEKRPAKFR